MSHRRWCDATNRPEKKGEEFVEFGTVIARHYCAEPGKDVERYLAALDDLHTELAAEFHKRRTELRDVLIARWPQIYLPDETNTSTEERIAVWEARDE